METCSSGEDLAVKARKPYTITKQREKWTDEEHNRFLEALKLYGRAWQRIEEYIGTKTAVQIRSHAQKFFSKLEKEALSKGIPKGQALDIDIPPPRPKRKPSNPYPRKTCIGTITAPKEGNVESQSPLIISKCENKEMHFKHGTCLEKMVGVESSERKKNMTEKSSFSESFTFLQGAPFISNSATKKSNATPPGFRKFVPFLKEINHKHEKVENFQTAKENRELKRCSNDCTDVDMDIDKLGLNITPHKTEATVNMSIGHKQPHEVRITSNRELQGTKSNGEHANFHSREENNGISGHCAKSNPADSMSMPNHSEVPTYPLPPFNNPSLFLTPEHSKSAFSSFHPGLPAFPPFTMFHNNHEAYRSLFNISSTFSNFLMSILLQNPAAHAAACVAASFLPSVDGKTSNPASDALNSGILPGQVNNTPSMTAIVAATVAAATAWWATHGFFPFCQPLLSTGFSGGSTPSTTGTIEVNDKLPQARETRKHDDAHMYRLQAEHILDSESPEALVTQSSSSKSLPLTSSESDQSGSGQKPCPINLNDSDVNKLNVALDNGFNAHGDKSKNEHKLDICSCGSNKSSSNEIETEAVLEKDEEIKEPEKPSLSETNCRRFRSSGSAYESWKEVSEEGRLAFRALFSREVLPQSFSPPSVEDGNKKLEETIVTPTLKLKIKDREYVNQVSVLDSSSSRSDNNQSDKSILTTDSGHMKSKSFRTGFKPYKRCSMEAKEGRTSICDEKSNKKSRLESGDASTR